MPSYKVAHIRERAQDMIIFRSKARLQTGLNHRKSKNSSPLSVALIPLDCADLP
jgi:hypothetical protein